jgi:hypothetical protein
LGILIFGGSVTLVPFPARPDIWRNRPIIAFT